MEVLIFVVKVIIMAATAILIYNRRKAEGVAAHKQLLAINAFGGAVYAATVRGAVVPERPHGFSKGFHAFLKAHEAQHVRDKYAFTEARECGMLVALIVGAALFQSWLLALLAVVMLPLVIADRVLAEVHADACAARVHGAPTYDEWVALEESASNNQKRAESAVAWVYGYPPMRLRHWLALRAARGLHCTSVEG